MRLSFALFSLVLLSQPMACKKYDPKRMQSGGSRADYAAKLELDCTSGLNLRPVPGSKVNWEVKKFLTAVGSSSESYVSGSNGVDGIWKINRRNMALSQGNFTFDVLSTDSKDNLRDDRIKEYVFGQKAGLPIKFSVTELAGGDTTVPTEGTRQIVATGVLEVAGIASAPIRVPLLVKNLKDSTSITPAEIVKINLRSTAAESGINLSKEVEHILSFVPGVGMLDDVVIDFNITLKDACAAT